MLAIPVLHQLGHVPALGRAERGHAPIVEDQDIDAGEPREQSRIGAVRTGQGELVEEPRGTAVDRPVATTQGVLGEGAGDEGLPQSQESCRFDRLTTGGARQEPVEMNFPSKSRPDASDLEFEVTVDEASEPASASPAKPATVVLVIIPRGIRFKVDMESHPGATCVKIPVGEAT